MCCNSFLLYNTIFLQYISMNTYFCPSAVDEPNGLFGDDCACALLIRFAAEFVCNKEEVFPPPPVVVLLAPGLMREADRAASNARIGSTAGGTLAVLEPKGLAFKFLSMLTMFNNGGIQQLSVVEIYVCCW